MINIKHVAILLFPWLALASPASAQLALTGAGPGAPSSGYVGPGDLIAASNWAFYGGFRCFTKAYTGSVFIVVDSNSGHTTTVGCTGAGDGSFNVSGSPADSLATLVSDCNSSHAYCTLTRLYDQTLGDKCGSASCDLKSSTTAGQLISNCPIFTRSNSASPPFCVIGVPATTAYVDVGGGPPTETQPFSMVSLSNRTAGSSNLVTFFYAGNDDHLYNGANLECSAGTAQGYSISNNAWTALACTMSNTAGIVQFNSTVKGSSLALGTDTPIGSLQMFETIGTGDAVDVAELGILSGDQSANYTALYSNESAYWGGF